MLVIGSQAAKAYGVNICRDPVDWDLIASRQSWDNLLEYEKANNKNYSFRRLNRNDRKDKVILNGKRIEVNFYDDFPELKELYVRGLDYGVKCYEFPGAYFAPLDLVVALKKRQLCYPIHFDKTIFDFNQWKQYGPFYYDYAQVVKKYFTAKFGEPNNINLNVSSEQFLADTNANCKIDHDTLHEMVAHPDPPVYTLIQVNPGKALLSRDDFYDLPDNEQIKLACEEICVIALERGILPHNMSRGKAFRKAHEHTIQKLSKGWFRDFCIEYYSDIQDALFEKYYSIAGGIKEQHG